MTIKSLTCLSLLALLAFGAGAQTAIPVEIEAGYRWTDVSGNRDLYRTQIDERSGFLVRTLTFFTATKSGFADQIRVDATDLGAGPASSLRVEAGKADAYKLRLGYRSFDTFSALPAFANPLFSRGITPGQHTYDRTRQMFDADLEILPGRKIAPFVGYSQSRYEGPGLTTYALGGDEFLLAQDLNEHEREIRAGANFDLGKYYGSVTQGWRTLESDEQLTLAQGASAGNNSGSLFGRPITGTAITRDGSTDVDTPFTTAFLTAEVHPRVRLTGSFVRFAADGDSVDDEAASGSFVSFAAQRIFSNFTDSVSSRAKNTTWRGSARAEVSLADRVAFLGGYRREHRELSGDALVRTVYLDSVDLGGVDRRDFEELLAAESSLDREANVIEAALVARSIGPYSLRAGFTRTKFDFGIAPDLAEIVVPGSQGGDFERSVNSFDVSGSFDRAMFSTGVSYRRDKADDAVLRTDFTNRDRIRVRAAFHTPGNAFRAGITAEELNQDNDQTFDAKARQYTADVEVSPAPTFRLRAGYSRLRANSTVTIRRPETFALDLSSHREDGNAIEAGFAFDLHPVTVDIGASRFDNKGSIPFNVDRYRVRAVYDFLAHAGVAAEWSQDNYTENAPFGTFDAGRYGIFLRYRP